MVIPQWFRFIGVSGTCKAHRKQIRKALTLPSPGFGGLPDFFGEHGLSQSGMSYTIFVVNNIVDNNCGVVYIQSAKRGDE